MKFDEILNTNSAYSDYSADKKNDFDYPKKEIPSLSKLLNFEKFPKSMLYSDKKPLMEKDVFSPYKKKTKKIPLILGQSKERYLGEIVFYNKLKKYGFIRADLLNSDVFFHDDDIINYGVNAKKTKEFLTSCFDGNEIKVSFECMIYVGKYEKSLKAINIKI